MESNKFTIKFSDQTELINMLYDIPFTFSDRNIILLYQSFKMAAKNSSMKRNNAGAEYFKHCISKAGYEDIDFYRYREIDPDNYKNVLGRMLHNYTYLRDGLRTDITIGESSVEVVNTYEKFGVSKVLVRRSVFSFEELGEDFLNSLKE